MNKLFFSMVLGIIGCTTMANPTQSAVNPQDIIAQRDKANPASVLPGSGFNASEAKQFLEFCIELNNQD
ncbi:MAG: hypothetical protein ABL925_13375, partial [Methylococcales bacterium]